MWRTRVWWRTSRGTNTTQTSLAQWVTTSSSSCGTHASRHGTVSAGPQGAVLAPRQCWDRTLHVLCVVWACSGARGGKRQQKTKLLVGGGDVSGTFCTSSFASCWLCLFEV
jgi:hypothetical protein